MGSQRDKLLKTIVELRGRGETFPAIGLQVGLSEESVRGLWRRHAPKEARDAAVERAAEARVPEGVEPPGVRLEGNEGYISTGPIEVGTPDFEALLRHFGFDPEHFEILEPVNVRTWDAAVGGGKVRRMWYHRANIRRRRTSLYLSDVNELVEFIRDRGPVEPLRGPEGREAFVFAPSDLQLGKSDGDGVKGTVTRFRAALASAVERIDELRGLGRGIGHVSLIHLADGIENTAGHYDMQSYSVELNRRDQTKLLRELLWEATETFAGVVSSVNVSGVAGNHPENRNGKGKAYTSFGDNDDLAVLDQLHMVAELTKLPGVTFTIPGDELEIVVDACGTKIGVAHGHQMKSGSTPEQRVKKWWEDQLLGRLPISEADILMTGHLHHLIVKELNGRWWMQCPTLESRSDWARSTMGAPGCPGILTYTTAGGRWRDLQVL